MSDALRQLVRDYDRRRNSPRQLRQTERSAAPRLTCLGCGKTPMWRRSAETLPICMDCGGRMIEVTA